MTSFQELRKRAANDGLDLVKVGPKFQFYQIYHNGKMVYEARNLRDVELFISGFRGGKSYLAAVKIGNKQEVFEFKNEADRRSFISEAEKKNRSARFATSERSKYWK